MLRQSLLRRAASAATSRTLALQPASSFLTLSRRLTTAPQQAPPSSPSISADLPQAAPTSAASTATTVASPPAPYLVSRTPSLFLPVYQDTKRGGNKKLTVLKKIQGDARVLKEELRYALGLEEKKIRINHVTGHIEIAGFRKEEVVNYLTQRGF